jgi:hypothetical protein
MALALGHPTSAVHGWGDGQVRDLQTSDAGHSGAMLQTCQDASYVLKGRYGAMS